MTAAPRETVSRTRDAEGLASIPTCPGTLRGSPRARVAALLVLALATQTLASQQSSSTPNSPPSNSPQPSSTTPRIVTTPDGCRFLLYPTGGPPVVSWVVRTPAGPVEERDGEEGLAFAVARAAMAGTGAIGSIDRAAEQDLLQRLDADEMRAMQLALAGQPPPPDLLAALASHRSAAVKVADPLAFERALRAAPAGASRLSQSPQAILLHLELPIEAVARVADLLVARREGAVLRGLYDEWRGVRVELAAANAADTWAAARDEVRWLAYRGHALGRPALGAAPAPTSRARAHEVFARTHRPERSRHVLVGGFDADAIEAVLMSAFSRSALPTDPLPLPPAIAPPRGELTGRILGGAFAGMAVACRTAPDSSTAAVSLAATWLADGDGSFLARTLRAKGLGVEEVRVTHPFPAASAAPFVLIEVRADARQGSDAGRRQALVTGVDVALNLAASATPTAAELSVVRARLGAHRLRQVRSHGGLATRLALHWEDDVADPLAALVPFEAQTDAMVLAALRGMLHRDRRVRVTQEPAP